MRAPFPYYGAKGRLAPMIAEMLPPHRAYVEPFCGSAAVLFAKVPAVHETINDLDGEVVHFFRVMREQPEELARVCKLTPYARAEYEVAREKDADVDDIERARRFFIRATQAYNANVGLTVRRSAWSNGSHSRGSSRAVTARDRADELEAAAARLRSVVIESRDALLVIEAGDGRDCVMYVDPPYLATTRTSLNDRHKRARDYVHEFAAEQDHRALAEVLHACEATVLLSGYHSPLYDELYGDWWTTEVTITRPTTNRAGVTGAAAVEVVWCNRALSGAQGAFDV